MRHRRRGASSDLRQHDRGCATRAIVAHGFSSLRAAIWAPRAAAAAREKRRRVRIELVASPLFFVALHMDERFADDGGAANRLAAATQLGKAASRAAPRLRRACRLLARCSSRTRIGTASAFSKRRAASSSRNCSIFPIASGCRCLSVARRSLAAVFSCDSARSTRATKWRVVRAVRRFVRQLSPLQATNPSVLNEFAAAVGLFFFALLPDTIAQVAENGMQSGAKPLSYFFNDRKWKTRRSQATRAHFSVNALHSR